MKMKLLGLAIASLLASTAATAASYQAGDFVVRGGATIVDPDNNNETVNVPALGGDTPLSVSVEDNTQLGLNFVYFYSSNWAVELLAATPFKHDIILHDPQGIAAGVFEIEGLDVNGATLAEVTHLPPTLSALYYFNTGTNFMPYVGAGINYTVFFDEEFESAPQSLGFNDLDLDGSWGIALQVGADYQLGNNWHINASARYIDINTEANFMIGDEITGSADVDIDPMVYSIMLGYKF
ncbi:OmpW family outer membrane protein [Thalassotalea ponticola]|uniref:OmpW/AlkL family protein n=1 Tax=Thalassotalea ponticola TaxID=1523392 RepID=UPI0025B3F839|nr:OmpW family outer membrane protein [Thalassotalea ponticola]MDN3653040.1 OmpW family outer membrane protein [Thalassotalea ponticola]